jgi:ADP-ribose pyrophosphatase
LFAASDLKAGTAAREADEFLEVVPTPLTRVLELIRDGSLRDAKTLVAILYLAGFKMGL